MSACHEKLLIKLPKMQLKTLMKIEVLWSLFFQESVNAVACFFVSSLLVFCTDCFVDIFSTLPAHVKDIIVNRVQVIYMF